MKKFFDKFSDNEGNEFFELNSFRDDIPVELLLKNKTKNENRRKNARIYSSLHFQRFHVYCL